MTSKIQQLIDEISRKQKDLHGKLVQLSAEKEQLVQEVNQVKAENQALKATAEEDKQTINALRSELATEKIQVVEKTVVSTKRNDEEIDELVKEIEFCINQLKNNE